MSAARRVILISATLALAVAPLAVHAQQAPQTARIGWLASGGADRNSAFITSFRQAMRDLGYVEGNNLVIEARYASGQFDKVPGLAAGLIAVKPDVLIVEGTPAAQEAKKASSSIPIVMTVVADPIGAALVDSLARPGGNVTGLTDFKALGLSPPQSVLARAEGVIQ
jgi:putative ABC transport system substrate-binding protein